MGTVETASHERGGTEFAGRVAIVTGGSGSIGRATAELLVAQGASVVIADVDIDGGEHVAASLGDAAVFQRADVSDAGEVQALVDRAVDHFGGLHIMFNNAGIGSGLKRFLSDDLEDFQRIVNVNLFGVIIGSQRAARHMKDHGGGSIINNASIAAVNAGAGMISYRVSKAAIAHATKCMAIDLAPYDDSRQLPHARAHPDRDHELRHGSGARVHAAARTRGTALRRRQRGRVPVE